MTYVEFGVHKGESLFWWSANNDCPQSTFLGYDSFEGLPEDWSPDKRSGTFSTGGRMPESQDTRVKFVKGWFHHTLHATLPEIDFSRRVIVHMDADLYRSSIFPLMVIGPMLKKDDLLIFDEFMDSIHEFRAFEDSAAIFNWKYEVIAASIGYEQVAIRILECR